MQIDGDDKVAVAAVVAQVDGMVSRYHATHRQTEVPASMATSLASDQGAMVSLLQAQFSVAVDIERGDGATSRRCSSLVVFMPSPSVLYGTRLYGESVRKYTGARGHDSTAVAQARPPCCS